MREVRAEGGGVVAVMVNLFVLLWSLWVGDKCWG